jgi:hypothetical protein
MDERTYQEPSRLLGPGCLVLCMALGVAFWLIIEYGWSRFMALHPANKLWSLQARSSLGAPLEIAILESVEDCEKCRTGLLRQAWEDKQILPALTCQHTESWWERLRLAM